jgi:hypothetical protein
MAVKGGGGQRRDYRGQRGVIAASEVAEASWIWTIKMHATEGGSKQEDGSIFLWQWQQILIRYLGLGWEEAHHPWLKNKHQYTALELLKHLYEVVIPLQDVKEVLE